LNICRDQQILNRIIFWHYSSSLRASFLSYIPKIKRLSITRRERMHEALLLAGRKPVVNLEISL